MGGAYHDGNPPRSGDTGRQLPIVGHRSEGLPPQYDESRESAYDESRESACTRGWGYADAWVGGVCECECVGGRTCGVWVVVCRARVYVREEGHECSLTPSAAMVPAGGSPNQLLTLQAGGRQPSLSGLTHYTHCTLNQALSSFILRSFLRKAACGFRVVVG